MPHSSSRHRHTSLFRQSRDMCPCYRGLCNRGSAGCSGYRVFVTGDLRVVMVTGVCVTGDLRVVMVTGFL